MKTFTFLLISMLGLAAATVPSQAKAQGGFSASVNFNTFYNQLSPYGQWLDVPRYGRVWSYNEPGFRPYATNGQWDYTDEGWYWNSNYEWGSIPFHYGRWELDPYYGWIWIPGYDYAPAWVVWSQAGDCFGWAPLGFGLDINVSLGRIPSNRWMYASMGNLTRPGVDRYCMPYSRNGYYYGRQQPVVNIYTQRNVRYMGGPRWDDRFGNNRFDRGQRYPVRDGRFDNRGGNYDNRGRNYDNRGGNYDNRPGNYDNRYGNREGNFNSDPRQRDYSNNNRRNDNDIHYDPSRYDRNSAIAGNRPPFNQDPRGRDQDMRPQTRPMEQAPQMRPTESRPQFSPRPEMREPRSNPEPRMQPQRNEGARPMSRERRIF